MPRPSDPNARAKLLAAAAEVFSARGLDDAKVEDIAARAGLSKGSFYLHFDSKDHAFRHLVEAMLERLRAKCEEVPDDFLARGGTVEEHLARLVAHDAELFDFLWSNRGLVGLLLNGGQCAAYQHLVECYYDEAASKTRRMLLKGIEVGVYRADLDVDIATAFISGAYDRLARRIVRDNKRPDFHKMFNDMQRLVLCGVGSVATLARLVSPAVKKTPASHAQPRRRLPVRVKPRSNVTTVPKAPKRAPR